MKNLKKYKKIIYGVIILAVIFGGNKVYQTYKNANPNVKFEIVKLENRDLVKSIEVDGQVVADYEISLASEIPGIISKVYVEEGDFVKKGQLLMKLKDTDYRGQVNSAYAVQKINEASLEKTKNPNHNLDLDKRIIEDSRDTVIVNIKKLEDDIEKNIESLDVYLSQILRMDIDDYFDHTEYDSYDNLSDDPIFTYDLKYDIEEEKLEKMRKELGFDYYKYKKNNKNIENSIDILNKFDSLVYLLYKDSRDLKGFQGLELENIEKKLSVLRNQILDKKSVFVSLNSQLVQLQKQLDSNYESEKKVENVVNPADLKLAEERIRQAKVQTHNAYTQLQKTYIRAPKSGIIVDVLKEVGEYAAPSAPLIKISSEKKYIEVDIPEVDIAKIKKGMSSDIKIDAFGDRVFKGKIDFIYPEKKEIFGIVYYKSRVLFDGDNWKKENILPGMSVEVEIPYAEQKNVVSIARGVAKKDSEKYFVEVLNPDKKAPKDNKFIKKYFEVGFIGDNFVEVKSDELNNFEIVKITELKKK